MTIWFIYFFRSSESSTDTDNESESEATSECDVKGKNQKHKKEFSMKGGTARRHLSISHIFECWILDNNYLCIVNAEFDSLLTLFLVLFHYRWYFYALV